MAGQRKLIDLIIAKWFKHLIKLKYEEYKNSEVTAPSGNTKA